MGINTQSSKCPAYIPTGQNIRCIFMPMQFLSFFLHYPRHYGHKKLSFSETETFSLTVTCLGESNLNHNK